MSQLVKILNDGRILLPIPHSLKEEAKRAAKNQEISLSAYLRMLIVSDLESRNHTITITTKIL
jgi:hypothetical protein